MARRRRTSSTAPSQPMAAAGLDAVRIDLLWAALEPEPGTLRRGTTSLMLDAGPGCRAQRHGLALHPTLFIGGEVGDAYWDVPWRDGRQPALGPGAAPAPGRHVAALARRWQDEPPSSRGTSPTSHPSGSSSDTTDDDARAWTTALVDAHPRRGSRPPDHDRHQRPGDRPRAVPGGRRGGAAGLRCVHPYPIYSGGALPGRPAVLADDARGGLRDGARGAAPEVP